MPSNGAVAFSAVYVDSGSGQARHPPGPARHLSESAGAGPATHRRLVPRRHRPVLPHVLAGRHEARVSRRARGPQHGGHSSRSRGCRRRWRPDGDSRACRRRPEGRTRRVPSVVTRREEARHRRGRARDADRDPRWPVPHGQLRLLPPRVPRRPSGVRMVARRLHACRHRLGGRVARPGRWWRGPHRLGSGCGTDTPSDRMDPRRLAPRDRLGRWARDELLRRTSSVPRDHRHGGRLANRPADGRGRQR